MKFSLKTILWVFALLASAVATFGFGGVFATLTVLWLWRLVLNQRPFTWIFLLVTVALTGTFIGTILPAAPVSRGVSQQEACHRNLEYIGLALVGRYWELRESPTAQWRDSFYSPKLVCPVDLHTHDSSLSYFAVIDPRCAWTEEKMQMLSNVEDGASTTILLCEAHNRESNLNDVRELSFDEALELLSNPKLQTDGCHKIAKSKFYKSAIVRNVLFADGSVRSLKMPLPRKLASALLTANGGELVTSCEILRLTQPELDYSIYYSGMVFIFLSLLPVFNTSSLKNSRNTRPS